MSNNASKQNQVIADDGNFERVKRNKNKIFLVFTVENATKSVVKTKTIYSSNVNEPGKKYLYL